MKKSGYSNPALRAMGLRNVRVPSGKWLVFWGVVAAGLGAAGYDKYEQRRLRSHYVSVVKGRGLERTDSLVASRKVSVFIAPPPSDYLESSLRVWRRYIKSVFYYAGLDYEVFTEERQGVIRHEVGSRIRKLRRDLLAAEEELAHAEASAREGRSLLRGWWYNKERASGLSKEKLEELQAKKWRDEFSYKQVLGVFYRNARLLSSTIVDEDSIVADAALAGGVVCVGRGAYKEYLSGVMEGVLGPLEEPVLEATPTVDAANGTADDAADKDTGKPPAPFISPEAYSCTPIPSELDKPVGRHPSTGVPALFEQPLLVVPVPRPSGFTQIPKRVYRFFTARYYAEECYRAATAMVLQQIRPYDVTKDLDIAVAEEAEWPAQWVQKGRDRGSEWVQELKADPRVLSRMSVVEPLSEDSTVV